MPLAQLAVLCSPRTSLADSATDAIKPFGDVICFEGEITASGLLQGLPIP